MWHGCHNYQTKTKFVANHVVALLLQVDEEGGGGPPAAPAAMR